MELDTAMELSLWKDEPLSPTLSGLEEVQSDVWQIFNDNGGNKAHSPKNQLGGVGGWLPDSPSDSCDSIKARGQLASQLLDDLDFKDEDSFSDWYETKTDLPMFDALPSPTSSLEAFATRPFASLTPLSGLTPSPFTALAGPAAVLVQALPPIASPLQQQHLLPLVTDTATLLEEFESVFGAVEQSHGGALTPPQSPPHNHYYPGVPQVLQQQQFSPQVQLQPLLSSQYSAPQPTVAVDDQQWPAVSQEAALPFAPPSPCTSSNSSSFCPESPAIPSPPSPASSGSDDPDWDPSSVEEYTPTPTKSSGSGGRKRSVKRSKPYSSEDKRIRKKEQNKNAATRYRMKKKAEVEEILGEENELREKNDELTAKVADISQEIRYLKGLMRELFRSRGLIK